MEPSNRSIRISNISFVCTMLIVVLHCRIAPKRIADSYSYYPYLYDFLGALADAAVPTFFAISVFLFYRNYHQSIYKRKMKTRVKSLLIPYFIFSFFSLIVFHLSMILVKGHDELITGQLIREFFLASNDPPIWYIRTLILFVLISPIVYAVINRSHWMLIFVLIILTTVLNVLCQQPYTSLQFWAPVVIAFSALSIKSENSKSLMVGGGRIFPQWLVLVTLVVFIIFVVFVANKNRYSAIYYIYRMSAPFFIAIISDLFFWKPLKIQRFTFFIFMFHFLPKLLTATMHTYPILTLFRIIFALAFCIVVGMLLEKLTPRTWAIINGGRINV